MYNIYVVCNDVLLIKLSFLGLALERYIFVSQNDNI